MRPSQALELNRQDVPVKEQMAAVRELDGEIGRFESKRIQIEALRETMECRLIASLCQSATLE